MTKPKLFDLIKQETSETLPRLDIENSPWLIDDSPSTTIIQKLGTILPFLKKKKSDKASTVSIKDKLKKKAKQKQSLISKRKNR